MENVLNESREHPRSGRDGGRVGGQVGAAWFCCECVASEPEHESERLTGMNYSPPCDNCGAPSRGTAYYNGRMVDTCTRCAADHGLPMRVDSARY